MSNTDIEQQQSQYNVSDAWPIVEPSNVDDCLEQFIQLSYSGKTILSHGAYQNWGCIRSSLDLLFEKEKVAPQDRKAAEAHLLESFAKEAEPHLPPGARRHIEVARLKWKTLCNTGTVFVGRHYGLKTRCVGWTQDCFTALFFACRRHFGKPGVVWWVDCTDFWNAIRKQWQSAYGKTENIEDDFERDFIGGKGKDVLICFGYPQWMQRPTEQKARITLCGQYDVRHDEAIHRLDVHKCGRIVIGAQMKADLLNRLDRLGINGSTLGIGDMCVETIATDIADRLRKQGSR